MFRGERSTVEGHLPEHRRDLRHRSQEHWMDKAKAIGPEVAQLVEATFGADDVLLQLRKVQAVVRLLERHPKRRARRTAQRAPAFGCVDYQVI